ncbi:hypothetical protein FCM35_KLT17040 [Carex littledalei]|uniref:Uncharacterized protein n=1 Tax=Carex littledalei TaxID=544730 RepID=A0A833VWF0_9POAL|nr:hypothetical protein FCM35_KLT17040 [Carex littledalei]
MKSPEFSAGFCEEYSEKDWNSPVPMDPEMGFNAPTTYPFSNFQMGQRDDMYCSSSNSLQREYNLALTDDNQNMGKNVKDNKSCAIQANVHTNIPLCPRSGFVADQWLLWEDGQEKLEVACDAELCTDKFKEKVGTRPGCGFSAAVLYYIRSLSTVMPQYRISKVYRSVYVCMCVYV